MYQEENENILIVVLVIIILIAVGVVGYNKFFNQPEDTIKIKTKSSTKEINKKRVSGPKTSDQKIVVHLGGEVNKPGVYECRKNSRLYTVLKKAGGPTNKANLNAINLATTINDGQKIIIPKLVENKTGRELADKININQAKQEKLEELSGIGPATAKKIIDYRITNGNFKNVKELTGVSGIGPKTIVKIKAEVTY